MATLIQPQLLLLIYSTEKEELSVRITQTDTTEIPVAGLSGRKVLPYADCIMTMEKELDNRYIKSITVTGGDIKNKYIMHVNPLSLEIIESK